MRLISLEEWQRIAQAQRASLDTKGFRNQPNGIACPKCGKELVDCDRGEILTSYPPQYAIRCLACPWRGYRTIA